MDNHIPEIQELIKQFSKLPGLGSKSAKRIILKLIAQGEYGKAIGQVFSQRI